MSRDELSHFRLSECARNNFWCASFPPVGCVRPMVKADPAELPRIAEDKRSLRLLQDKVIVFGGAKIRWFHAQSTTHPEMNPQPTLNVVASPDFVGAVARKREKHLFPARLRPAQFSIGKMTS